tara:strand:- start:102 stop:596 length:495 start_codon:yes stop_codon:yes gene_type:complete
MKHLLLTTIAAVLLVGCGEFQLKDTSEAKAQGSSNVLIGPDIHYAIFRGNIEDVKHQLASGIDVNIKNKNGATPLHYAAMYNKYEIAKILINKGADTNAKNKGGATPLDWAKTYNSPEIANLINRDLMFNFTAITITLALLIVFLYFLRKHGGKTGEELKAEGK